MIGRTRPAGDLDTQRDGLRTTIRDLEYAQQKVRQRLMFIRGEWVLNTTLGVPWFESILIKNPDLRFVQATVRDVIKSVPGFSKVDAVEVKLEGRTLSLAYRAVYGSGEQVADVLVGPIAS